MLWGAVPFSGKNQISEELACPMASVTTVKTPSHLGAQAIPSFWMNLPFGAASSRGSPPSSGTAHKQRHPCCFSQAAKKATYFPSAEIVMEDNPKARTRVTSDSS